MATILPKELLDRGEKTVTGNLEGLVPGNGSLTPKFILVGEAPGETEVTTRKPFTGRAGIELDKMLAELGVSRQSVYITSALRSRPFKVVTKRSKRTGENYQKKDNRPATQAELKRQAFLLDYELANLPTNLIMTIGNTGLHRILGPNYQVGAVHGQLFTGSILTYNYTQQAYQPTVKQYRVFPTFHPAAIFYNRKLAPDLAADLQIFKQILASNSEGSH
ncbi:uracil-DNA glycosylase [Loigolactobacillus backii]|uniref:Uracil-DNA glycosylase n=1 Tax=Loigolactobacillus backii TaxID=375175 RepID=A0A192H3I4_9LACO|nr:uracil-DNA glycosylase [Loigolactobacillus backii]ANK59511.1 uracil-DNA glycosylase [Loigolactobacillus backii]ANK62930.1 uracil-DNA glycosylase [Loigolactobacillus backii]ANK64504.1 uracil-DNA glycosylase [Loigolactobacillus backii]ANK67100.1 uracil-DNA glycosylase [Loigolactobacillus backii]ANK70062.1 uracil-DNA glycosylase [Loigolactobacillus backii]